MCLTCVFDLCVHANVFDLCVHANVLDLCVHANRIVLTTMPSLSLSHGFNECIL